MRNKTLPDDLVTLIGQLVHNGQITMAVHVLKIYFCRCWNTGDEVAAYYVKKYFQKYYAKQLEHYQAKRKRALR